MNGQILFKGHVTKLLKIQSQLKMHQKPDHGQVILSETNQRKTEAAVILLGEVMKLLNDIT